MAGRAGHNEGPDGPYPGADHPSWPAGATDGDWPQPGTDYGRWPATEDRPGSFEGADHPSWPTSDASGWQQGAADPSWPYPGADHPSWPAGAAGGDWPQPGADYPSWPAGGPGSGWVPTHGEGAWQQRQAPVVQHHDERWQTAAPVPPRAPVPATRWEYPARPSGAHAKTGQWSAKLARTQDAAPQTYYELAFGDGRLQVMLTEPPAARQEWATGAHARQVEVLEPPRGQAAWTAEDLRNADTVRVAERILSDADYRAAEVQREASAQATAVREAAEAEAAEIRQQAAALQQQATDQAAATRQAAEREAAEMRAATQSMSGELHRVAAYVTQNLATPDASAALLAPAPAALPAEPATRPARPAARPTTKPAARPTTKPAARPTTTPAARPTTKPAARPKTTAAGRQAKIMRRMAFAIAAVSVIGAISGTTELALHGFPFFILRANGAGAGETGPKEPVNPELPQKTGEVQCSLLHLACTLK